MDTRRIVVVAAFSVCAILIALVWSSGALRWIGGASAPPLVEPVAGSAGDPSEASSAPDGQFGRSRSKAGSPAGSALSDVAPAAPQGSGTTPEPTGDLGLDHISTVIERSFSDEWEWKFRRPTNVRSKAFLGRFGLAPGEVSPDDMVALDSLAAFHDEAVFEAFRTEFVERYMAYRRLIDRGDMVQYVQESKAPIPADLEQGATLGFLPGPRLGVRRLMILTGDNSPAWKAAYELKMQAEAAREAAFREFFQNR